LSPQRVCSLYLVNDLHRSRKFLLLLLWEVISNCWYVEVMKRRRLQ